MDKRVIIYHVWAGERDEFTEDFDDALEYFEQLTKDYDVDEVHLHAEEYANQADCDKGRLMSEECMGVRPKSSAGK